MRSRNRGRWWGSEELPKAHDEIPDGLGIGVHELRTGDGELMIYFRGNHLTPRSAWVVLGRYAEPVDGNKLYYVSDRTHPTKASVAGKPAVTYHEDLLMAMSWIMSLKHKWDEEHERH